MHDTVMKHAFMLFSHIIINIKLFSKACQTSKQMQNSFQFQTLCSQNLCKGKDRTRAKRSDGDNSVIASLLCFFPISANFFTSLSSSSTLTSQDAVQSVTLHLSRQSSYNKAMWSTRNPRLKEANSRTNWTNLSWAINSVKILATFSFLAPETENGCFGG